MTRDEALTRCRHLRTINARHQTAALDKVGRAALLEQARRLGLLRGKVITPAETEFPLLFDLLLYTSREGRSRGLDRYHKTAALDPASEEARVLDAMLQARFVVAQITGRHEVAGLVLRDLLRDQDGLWLMDEGLERSMPDGAVFAARLFQPDAFRLTTGVVVPVDALLVEEVLLTQPRWRDGSMAAAADDPRFSEALYRAAVHQGAMATVAFKPPD